MQMPNPRDQYPSYGDSCIEDAGEVMTELPQRINDTPGRDRCIVETEVVNTINQLIDYLKEQEERASYEQYTPNQ